MNNEKRVDKILDDLVKSGSNIPYLNELKDKSIDLVKKDEPLDEALKRIAEEIKDETGGFLESKNEEGMNYISGISTGIYLPSEDGEYKLKVIGGKKNVNLDEKVDEETLFDVASITKLYTLLLVFKLEEMHIINLSDRISDINPEFPNLGDFTWLDLIRLHGELVTDGRIDGASSYEEAYEIFKTLHLKSDTREENKYTDMGAMVISNTLEKIISEKLGKKMTYDEIMNEYLFKPLDLNNTMFNPKTDNISGNGNLLGVVNDPKARILGGVSGHAGIFTNSDDLAKLAKGLYSEDYLSKEHIDELGKVTFPNSKQSNKGNLGIYVKHPEGWPKTFTPPEFSDGSFSHQGFTGAVAAFDPNNKIHNNILVNSVYENEEHKQVKPKGMISEFTKYQVAVTKDIMAMYVAKEFYNRYCNVKEDIDDVKYVK